MPTLGFSQHFDLMSERKDLQLQSRMSPEGRKESGKNGCKQREHRNRSLTAEPGQLQMIQCRWGFWQPQYTG
jgi:hypothetical protein